MAKQHRNLPRELQCTIPSPSRPLLCSPTGTQSQHSRPSSVDSDSLDADTAPSSADAASFPRSVGATLADDRASALRADRDALVSPALTGFTFDLDTSDNEANFGEPIGIHFADPFVIHKAQAISHSRVKAGAVRKKMSGSEPPARSLSNSRRMQYFNDVFSDRKDEEGSLRQRIQRESPIVASLRTNVIVKDEYTVVTSLSHHLSERYRRPESTIMITIHHSACLMLGGSFEPAYILEISTIPTELQPVTNKRNAYLVQCFLAEVLHVPSNRGVVRFLAIEEERLAINGSTVAGEIERAEKKAGLPSPSKDDKTSAGGLVRTLTGRSLMRTDSKENRKSVANADAAKRKSTVPRALSNREVEPDQPVRRKSSTRSLRSKTSAKSLKASIGPPIPTEFPTDLLPTPAELSGFTNVVPQHSLRTQTSLPQIHRLSPLNSIGIPPAHGHSHSKDMSYATQRNSQAPTLPPQGPLPAPPAPVPGGLYVRKDFEIAFPPRAAQNSAETSPTSPSFSRGSANPAHPHSTHRPTVSNPTNVLPLPLPPPVPREELRGSIGHAADGEKPKLGKRKSLAGLFKRGGNIVKV